MELSLDNTTGRNSKSEEKKYMEQQPSLMHTINTSSYGFLHHTRLIIQPSKLDLDSRKRILIYTFIELLVSCVRSHAQSTWTIWFHVARHENGTHSNGAFTHTDARAPAYTNRPRQMSFSFYLPAFVQFSNARAMQVLNRNKFTSEKRYRLLAIIIIVHCVA